jgi:hypothetical protein
MNRKAQSGRVLFWGMAIVTFTILFFGLFIAINSFIGAKVATPKELKAEFISFRFANVPECFSKEAEGKVFPGIIDLDKFNDEQFISCYQTEHIGGLDTYNFRLVLETEGNQVTTDKYYNHDDFTLFQEVLVEKNGKVSKDRLIIYVQEEATYE